MNQSTDRRLPDDLRAAWSQLVPAAPDLGAELIRRWSEPHRRYHDLRHLAESLAALRHLGGGHEEQLAIWFHDAVFSGQPGTDEGLSAELAHDRLGRAGLPHDCCERVAQLVLITEHHRPDPRNEPECRVSDADLAVLAAEPTRYAESVADLRTEYRHLDDAHWVAQRNTAVSSFLARSHIFTSPAGSTWEAPARTNLAGELETLSHEFSANGNNPGSSTDQ
ncbi:MAG: hypothetical protein WAS07_10635 [Micropruina sp.]|nr:metal-dependent phosphohydrolase [Micropruina sp.]